MTGLPLLVDLHDRKVVVVGGGPVAAAKLRSLEPARADLTVVAPDAVEEIRAAGAAGALTWLQRPYRHGDLAAAHLVVAATGDRTIDGAVADDAEAAGVWCIRVDGRGTAAFMGAVRRGPLTIGVSTSGTSPALARQLRAELAERYGPEYGALAELLGDLRRDPSVLQAMEGLDAGERAARWRRLLDPDIVGALRNGRIDFAKEVALACLSSSTD